MASSDDLHDLTPLFEPVGLLGQGGFGAVHRARDTRTGREVALKLLHRLHASAVARFQREGAVTAALDHPGLVKVHAVGLFAGRPCIVYELVEGRPFAEAVRALDPRGRAALVRDAARAVGHAHERGVLHRDLKPDNLLVGDDGRVRVTDFGLAHLEGDDRLTATGAMVGTPTHMAPEQFATERRAPGPAIDVWALGLVLYEALTGRFPFQAGSLVELAARIEEAPIPRPRSIDPSIDRGLEAVCLRALERDPARRYPDAGALARDLDAALAGRPVAGRRPGLRALAAGVVVGLLPLVGLLTLGAWPAPPLPATTPDAPHPAAAAPTPPTTPPAMPMTPTTEGPRRPRRVAATRRGQGRWAVWVDGERVLTGAADDDVRLWSTATGAELRAWPLRARAAAAQLGGAALVVTTDGRLLRLAPDGDPVPVGRAPGGALVAAPTGRVAAVGPGKALLLDPATFAAAAEVEAELLQCLAISADGALLATGAGTGEVGWATLWDVAGAAPVRRWRVGGVPGSARSAAFSPDGRWLLLATSASQLVAIDVAAGVLVGAFLADAREGTPMLGAHRAPVRAVATSPDGRAVFSAAGLAGATPTSPPRIELRTWDLERRAQRGLVEVEGELEGLSVSPDGRWLAVGTRGDGACVRLLPLE
ncbi:MAG: protein kinase [Planctomycetes bacterium]|nr:protein kinase [Planctomycetota bacterium]